MTAGIRSRFGKIDMSNQNSSFNAFRYIYDVSKLLTFFIILGIGGCGTVQSLFPVYSEPQDGPKARMRVVYNGAAAKVYPNSACYQKGPTQGFDVRGFHFGGVKKNRVLGMPLAPSGNEAFDEVYVRAGQPITVLFSFRQEHTISTLPAPDQRGLETRKQITTCDAVPLTFVPTEGKDYEASFFFFLEGRKCAAGLTGFVDKRAGSYERLAMPPTFAPPCT